VRLRQREVAENKRAELVIKGMSVAASLARMVIALIRGHKRLGLPHKEGARRAIVTCLPRWMACVGAALLWLAFAVGASGATLIDCTAGTGTGDPVEATGFYVTHFPGSRLQWITLNYSARAVGTYVFSIDAHIDGYDGPIIGGGAASVLLVADESQFRQISYPFPPVQIPSGTTLAFTTNLVSGPAGPVFVESTTIRLVSRARRDN
jgi:hypothetical protein